MSRTVLCETRSFFVREVGNLQWLVGSLKTAFGKQAKAYLASSPQKPLLEQAAQETSRNMVASISQLTLIALLLCFS
uniref:Uncharacterized protein n=1 Tax=Zea mays TaxID=4577 RepID=A0A804QBP9_MAIZE